MIGIGYMIWGLRVSKLMNDQQDQTSTQIKGSVLESAAILADPLTQAPTSVVTADERASKVTAKETAKVRGQASSKIEATNNAPGHNNRQRKPPTTTRVSWRQDVFVTLVVTLVSFAAGYGVFHQANFGVIPSICIGTGLFLWLISAHFLITRLRLKALIDGRLKTLSREVEQLKKDSELTDLLAEGHNDLANRQELFADISKSLSLKMGHFEAQLGALPDHSTVNSSANIALTSKQQTTQISVLTKELQIIRSTLADFVHYHDMTIEKNKLRAHVELELLHLLIKQLAQGKNGDHSKFIAQALQVVGGLKKMRPPVRPQFSLIAGQTSLQTQNITSEQNMRAVATAPEQISQSAGAAQESVAQANVTQESVTQESVTQESASVTGSQLAVEEKFATTERVTVANRSDTEQSSAPGFIAPGRDMLTILIDAIENDKIELFMQPIVALPSRELCFYETFARLRDDAGQEIAPQKFLPIAREANLVSLVDNQLILQAVRVISRLNERGKGRTIFCNIALESLRDPDFFAEFIVFLEQNKWLAEQLILEVSQEIYLQCSQYELEKLDRIPGRISRKSRLNRHNVLLRTDHPQIPLRYKARYTHH